MQKSLAVETKLAATDAWFVALDQRSFTIRNSQWTIRVLGVHLEQFRTWLQLEFEQEPDGSLLLELDASAGVHDAINAIRAEILRLTVEPDSPSNAILMEGKHRARSWGIDSRKLTI